MELQQKVKVKEKNKVLSWTQQRKKLKRKDKNYAKRERADRKRNGVHYYYADKAYKSFTLYILYRA